MTKFTLFAGIWALVLLSSCAAQKTPPMNTPQYDNYDWEKPDFTWTLDSVLNEISGLSIVPGGQYLAAVQDEIGDIFLLDKQNGRIAHQINFWKDGDYEGIEYVGDKVYVIKKTGTLYEVSNAGTPEQSTAKYTSILTAENDVEGLGYHPRRHQLLVACKALPGGDLAQAHHKAIYAFDLNKRAFLPEPSLVLTREKVEQYVRTYPADSPNYEKISSLFADDAEDFNVSPTAIAVHPSTGHWYMVSAKSRLLFVLNDAGDVLHIAKLPKALHRQPEGLCFDEAGTLYISNEAKKDNPPLIHGYHFHPNGVLAR